MRRGLARAALLGLMACSADSLTGNVTPLTLSFGASQSVAGHSVVINGATLYACAFVFTAKTSGGDAADFAGWYDGQINYRLNSSGATATLNLTSGDMQDWFGTDKVHAGATAVATRQLSWTGPFTATVLFRYIVTNLNTASADSKTATLNVSC